MDDIKLNSCLHCGGESAFEITSRPDTVKAYCKDCGTQTKAIGTSLEYSAKQKVADLWNANADVWVEWIQPTGAHDAYAKGARVTHDGKKWVSLVDSNVWEPGVSGWEQT